jgi:hypothetical protein
MSISTTIGHERRCPLDGLAAVFGLSDDLDVGF